MPGEEALPLYLVCDMTANFKFTDVQAAPLTAGARDLPLRPYGTAGRARVGRRLRPTLPDQAHREDEPVSARVHEGGGGG